MLDKNISFKLKGHRGVCSNHVGCLHFHSNMVEIHWEYSLAVCHSIPALPSRANELP